MRLQGMKADLNPAQFTAKESQVSVSGMRGYALDCGDMSSVARNATACNELASDWMHRGMALLEETSSAKLEEAVECFDKAIALRQTLPLDENPWFRYGLSAGWLNRADALTKLGGKERLGEAVKSIDEALALLASLPLEENPLYPRRLAIAWINRGFTLQKQESPGAMAEIVSCFRRAISIVEAPAAHAISDKELLRAGAWINLGKALLQSPEAEGREVRDIAKKALVLLREKERTDRAAAEAGFKARHLLCQAIAHGFQEAHDISREEIAETTDVVDEGMALARHWEVQGENGFRDLARGLFRFGCRIYQEHQPHFLSEFILENLDPERAEGAFLLNQEMHDAAMVALWSALKEVQSDGFRSISTPRFEEMMARLRALRLTEERLGKLRHACPPLR